MRSLALAFIVLSVASCSHKGHQRQPSSETQPKEFKVILSLKEKAGKDIVSKIEILSTNTNPNVISDDTEYRIEIDGQPVEVPENAYATLGFSRRAYSYDSQSGGIEKVKVMICMMGGPARGFILESRYLTYKDYVIEGEELKPVYSEGACNFTEIYLPKSDQAQRAAIRTLAILQTIKNMLAK